MSIIRVQKNSNYSVMSNVHLQDENLSWKAKGLLSYLLSKPDSWQIYISHLKNQSTDGRDATASGMRELIDAGYITRDYTRNAAGHIIGRDYIVYETALEKKVLEKPVNNDDNPKTENPTLDNPTTVNPSLLNTDYIKDGLKKNNDDVEAPQPKPMAQEPQKPPSSSFSKNDLVSVLATLMALVPEQFQKPSIKKTIESGLKAHTEGYIKNAILYTVLHSNGHSWQKFKAYLGQCIDKNWHDGWEPEAQDTGIDLNAVRDRFKQMQDKGLEQLASAGNRLAIAELERRDSL